MEFRESPRGICDENKFSETKIADQKLYQRPHNLPLEVDSSVHTRTIAVFP
jgi:hypothetical protein